MAFPTLLPLPANALTFLPIAALCLAFWHLLKPAPPSRITLATRVANGAYAKHVDLRAGYSVHVAGRLETEIRRADSTHEIESDGGRLADLRRRVDALRPSALLARLREDLDRRLDEVERELGRARSSGAPSGNGPRCDDPHRNPELSRERA